ncbi:MAG: hypothetical protein RRY20_08710 [Bilophila sp.]
MDRLHTLPVWKLVSLLGAGFVVLLVALYFMTFYQSEQKQDLAYVVKQINFAISAENLEQLEPYVDFRALGRAFAKDLYEVQGLPPDKKAFRAISEQVQMVVLECFRARRENVTQKAIAENTKVQKVEKKYQPVGERPEIKSNEDAPNLAHELKKVPSLLPPDAPTQLWQHPFVIQGGDGAVAILSTSIHHTELDYTVELKLVARLDAVGWKVVEVANAKELIATHVAAQKKLYQRYVEDFQTENLRRRQLMNTHCFITECRAFLARRADKNDASLVVSIEGFNMGTETLLSSGIRCSLKNARGQTLATLPLNSVRHVASSDFFQQSWQVELFDAFPETAALLREETVQCTADVSAVSIGSGQIVFLLPPSERENIRRLFDPEYTPVSK